MAQPAQADQRLVTLKTVDKGFIQVHINAMAKVVKGIDDQIADKQALIDSLTADIAVLKTVRDGYKRNHTDMVGEL